jgi:hypothetical protein
VGHDDRRFAHGDQRLAEPGNHRLADEVIVRDIAAAAGTGPIRNDHAIAGLCERMRPAGTPVGRHQITSTRMGAAVDQKHRRLARPPARRLDYVEVGDGCGSETAGPANFLAAILRRHRRRCK